MTVDEVKAAICTYFNGKEGFDSQFIKSPTNRPAPVGRYISVGVDEVSQFGSRMTPSPQQGPYRFSQVAVLHFVEVEGDGDLLRKVRNELQLPSFIEHARKNCFTVWQFTDLEKIDTYDGKFYVRQWRFSCSVNFMDEAQADIQRIETVQPLDFEIERR